MSAGRTHPLPRAYWYIWAGTLVNKLGTFVVPFLALYLTQQRGFSAATAAIARMPCGAMRQPDGLKRAR